MLLMYNPGYKIHQSVVINIVDAGMEAVAIN